MKNFVELHEVLLKGLEVSPCKKVRINIRSAYKWGSGWSSMQATLFKEEVLGTLRNAGYKIKESDISGSCPSIIGKTWNDRINLYLHPMEFTGYAKIEDIINIMTILKSCKQVYEVMEPQMDDVYDLSDSQYRNLILTHTNDILEIWKAKKQNPNYWMHDFGMDFAKEGRVPRVGDSSGVLSSLDMDVALLDTMQEIFAQLK